jgi:hypothetical protein
LLLDNENAQRKLYFVVKKLSSQEKCIPKKVSPIFALRLNGSQIHEIDVISKKLIREVSIEQQLQKH